MQTLLKALQQVGANDSAEVLGCYFAPGCGPGETSALLLIAEGKGSRRSYTWGYYEEAQEGWDWQAHSSDETAARKGFLACIPVELDNA
jgi:hypothetical protein